MPDAAHKSHAQRNKDARKEQLRELLKGSEYLRQLHGWIDADLNAEELQVARFKADIALRLLAKCLPDQKAIEHTGEVVHSYAARLPTPQQDAEKWQQQHSPDARLPTMQ